MGATKLRVLFQPKHHRPKKIPSHSRLLLNEMDGFERSAKETIALFLPHQEHIRPQHLRLWALQFRMLLQPKHHVPEKIMHHLRFG